MWEEGRNGVAQERAHLTGWHPEQQHSVLQHLVADPTGHESLPIFAISLGVSQVLKSSHFEASAYLLTTNLWLGSKHKQKATQKKEERTNFKRAGKYQGSS